MKKIIFLIILLLIILSAIFYFGWVRVPENCLALGFSSITGYDHSFIKPGKLVWKWQKLIPKSYTLRIFRTETQNVDISAVGQLPSGGLYSSILAGEPDFSYFLSCSVSYTVSEPYLYGIAVSGEMKGTELDSFYSDINKKLKTSGGALLSQKIDEMLKTGDRNFSERGFEELLNQKLPEKMSEIEIKKISSVSAQLPDLDLYNAGKKLYLKLMDTKEDILIKEEKENALLTSEIEKRTDILKKYGELLTQYPILIEYLKASNENLLPSEFKK